MSGRWYPDLLAGIAKLREAYADWARDPDGWVPFAVAGQAIEVHNIATAIGYPLATEAPDVALDVEAIVAAARSCLARRRVDALAPPDGPVPERAP